jgi:hypothetical protein
MPDAAQFARDRYLQRIAIYKSFGYDRPAAVRFAVEWFVSNGFRLVVAEDGYLQSVAVLEKPE